MSGRRLVCIVEGHGEVKAVPILLRRLWEDEPSLAMPEIHSRDVIRIPRSKLLRAGELERAVELAGRRCGREGAVLVLGDADDDAACELGPRLLARARGARPDMRVAVVLAVREYEAWFLAAASSLSGSADLPDALSPPDDPEGIRDAKGWLSAKMPKSRYREVIHQPKLTAKMALEPERPCVARGTSCGATYAISSRPAWNELWRVLPCSLACAMGTCGGCARRQEPPSTPASLVKRSQSQYRRRPSGQTQSSAITSGSASQTPGSPGTGR